jgi:hypothetical protein
MSLTEEQKKLTKVEVDISRLEKLKTAEETTIATSTSALSAVNESIVSLGPMPIKPIEISDNHIFTIKAKSDASSDKLSKLIELHKEQILHLDSQRPILLPNPVLKPIPQLDPPIQI